LGMGINAMIGGASPTAPVVASTTEKTATEPAADPDKGWKVIFRSADPAIWNDDVNKGKDHFAMSLDLAPDELRFLRLKDVTSGDFVIIETTKQNLGKQGDDGKYGWNGANQLHFKARYLGIYHTIWQRGDREDPMVCVRPDARGWGFGGPLFARE